jgi:NADH-quinone oxidoreductase subunit A
MRLDGSSIPSPDLAPSVEGLISLGVYAAMALTLIAFLLLACRMLGHKTRQPLKGQPYESGVAGTGPAYPRQPAPFYLVAIFFIIFDIEIVFVASWAVAYDLLGWNGFFQILFFIVVLFLGLVYLWSRGGLNWGPQPRHRRNEVKH